MYLFMSHYHNPVYSRSVNFHGKYLLNFGLFHTEELLFDVVLIFAPLCSSASSGYSSGVLSVPLKWPRVWATSLEPSRSIHSLFPNLTVTSIKQVKKKPGSNLMVGFLAHTRAADAFTETIELTFETNRFPIDKSIGARLRNTSQDEGRYQHNEIICDKLTRVAINYFKFICSRLSLTGY